MQIITVSILLIFAIHSCLAVPYGFLGVRGKKSTGDTYDVSPYGSAELDNPYKLNDDERILVNYLIQQYGKQNGQWNDLYSYEKRVPYGFMGMRGKRSPIKDDTEGNPDEMQSNEVKLNEY